MPSAAEMASTPLSSRVMRPSLLVSSRMTWKRRASGRPQPVPSSERSASWCHGTRFRSPSRSQRTRQLSGSKKRMFRVSVPARQSWLPFLRSGSVSGAQTISAQGTRRKSPTVRLTSGCEASVAFMEGCATVRWVAVLADCHAAIPRTTSTTKKGGQHQRIETLQEQKEAVDFHGHLRLSLAWRGDSGRHSVKLIANGKGRRLA